MVYRQTVHKFGRNDNVANGVWEDVWMRGGTYPWPSAAGALQVFSASTDDDVGGDGARSIIVEGLDADFAALSETITLTGTSTTTGVSQFFRVNRAYVASGGEYATLGAGSNKGAITINTTAGAAVTSIPFTTGTPAIGFGQTEIARYTIPAGKIGYINAVTVNVDGAKPADVALFKRDDAGTVAAPFTGKRLQVQFDGVDGRFSLDMKRPLGPYAAQTDLWWAARGDGNATAVTVNFEIELVGQSS